MRTIVLHYHLFKNAGTSLDRILQRNFAGRWATREFPGQNNSAEVARWIAGTPGATAFSSHTMMGPPPRLPGVRVVSVMLLRDPLDRIRSAYRFERRQQADTFGAVLAKHTDLDGYVRVRLSLPHDRQCRNFQTWRLASLAPGPEPELARARQGLARLDVVGRVDDFAGAVAALKAALAEDFPDFEAGEVHANRSAGGGGNGSPEGAAAAAAAAAGTGPAEPPALTALLRAANADDLALMAQLAAPGAPA